MRTPVRILTALLLPALLSACLFGGDDDDRKPRRSGGGSVARTILDPTPRETQACYGDLSRADVGFTPIPDRDFGGGCRVIGALMLTDVGVPVTGLKAMRCPLARTFAGWVRYGVRPAAREILGSALVRVESFGSYSCRGVIGGGKRAAGKLSEHGLGNAVDIAAFVLADGRRITVEHGWRSDDRDVRRFLQVIRASACKRFSTVLSPDYNAAHYNHLHLDMANRPLCS